MADYAELPTTQIDADSPLIEDTLIKLRENPLAMFEGSPGAPRLQLIAIAGPVAGSNYFASRTISTDDAPWSLAFQWRAARPGTVRAEIQLSAGLSEESRGRIYINGVAVGALRSATYGAPSTTTEDFTVSTGDFLQFYVSSTGSVTHRVRLGVQSAVEHFAEVV